MRDSIPKFKIILFPILSYCMISCGATLPLQEVSNAKQEVTRAKFFNSEKYAKLEFDDSRTNLLQAHETAFSSSPNLKKVVQLAQASTEKAREAVNKSLPSYVKDLQKEVESAIDSASVAFAESLASDIFEQAVLLKSEGDEIIKNADASLVNLPQEDTVAKAAVYDEYEKGIKRYRDSIATSEKAKDLSLSQSQAVIDSSSDIEPNLDLVEKYSGEDKTTIAKIASMREEYKSCVELIENGSLRDGFKKLEKIRVSSNELMTSVILPYAKGRIKTATLKIEDADNFLHSDSDEAKSSVAIDNLTASKEAFTASVDLLAKERYYDSIQQTDESIRLAEEILKSRDKSEKSDSKISKRSSDNEKEKECSKSDCKEPCKKEECSEQECKESCTQKTLDQKESKLAPKKSEKKIQEKAKSTSIHSSTSTKVKWKKYTVHKKTPPETLWRIAADKKYLGNKDLWREIYKANKNNISDPNLIYPNQVILVPEKIQKTSSNLKTKK